MSEMSSGNHVGLSRLLIGLAFLSGCCALAYEILYMRVLTTLLGDMLYVHAALLSTFLVGIGLGAKLAHRFLGWLWLFELLTGAYAIGLPSLTVWCSGQSFMIPVTANPELTIATTIGFLTIPSLLIGFSIPLFSAYIKAYTAGRPAFQGVYMAYNLGALLSILAVEFLLVRFFGVSLSLALVGGLNLFNGVVLFALRSTRTEAVLPAIRRFSKSLIWALALASLASAVFQMFLLKLSFMIFNPHRENFAVTLSITMLGLFLGTWLAARVRWRFENFLLLVPIMIGGIFAAYMPLLALTKQTLFLVDSSAILLLAHKFIFGSLFGLGPLLLFGALIPAMMRSEREVASESGHLLWISSMANAAGYLVYVLIGHPWLTTDVLLALVAAAALLASLMAVRFRWSAVQAVVALLGVSLVVLFVMNWEERNFYLAQWIKAIQPGDEVINFKSGAENATLLRTEEFEWITYNGHPSINVQEEGVVSLSETISGVIPALGAPRLERALVLGLGTGITAGATARVFESTDVVEINDAFYKMMPFLSYANLDVGRNPAATLYLADGRAFLVGKDNTYDAIVNSIPAPTYFSASKIYTLEFYERVVKALKPDGVFCTWLSAENMSEQGVMTVLSALRRNFRYCDLRMIRDVYYMTTCSNQPVVTHSFRDLPVQLQLIDQLQSGLQQSDLTEFFEDNRVSDNIFEYFTPEVEQQNTDDHPVLEFMVVTNTQLDRMGEDPFLGMQELLNIDPVKLHEDVSSARMARRASVFYELDSWYWERNFRTVIEQDPVAAEIFEQWGYGKEFDHADPMP
jgi:spermidine synthase